MSQRYARDPPVRKLGFRVGGTSQSERPIIYEKFSSGLLVVAGIAIQVPGRLATGLTPCRNKQPSRFSDRGQNRSEDRSPAVPGSTQLSVLTPPRARASSHLHLAVCVGIIRHLPCLYRDGIHNSRTDHLGSATFFPLSAALSRATGDRHLQRGGSSAGQSNGFIILTG